MSKNELRVMARIMLIGVGLYVLLQTFLNILSNAAEIKHLPMIIIIVIGIYAVMALVIVYFLARCANRFSAKIAESQTIDDTQVSWLAVAFRLICVTAGVLFLYWSVPNLVVTLSRYIIAKPNEYFMSTKPDIVKYVVMLGLSIYLALGAPGFVRWQVRKTLKQCSKIVEQQPTWR